MSEYTIGGIVTVVIAIIGFVKHLVDKKNAVREILEKHVETLEKKNLELEKKIEAANERLLKRRGKQ